MSVKPLKAALIGCGAMGRNQAKILHELPEFDLVAVCDVMEENVQKAAEMTGAKAYTDVAAMLAEAKPEMVGICTHNATHAPLTIQAAEAGVKGVYCEKPMATNMKDARAMVEACKKHGTALVINHQRRIGADLLKAREMIDAGALGRIELVRGTCAGDILSDGTHLIDSIMWLLGDQPAQWVVGQIHREINEAMEKRAAQQIERSGFVTKPGFRYGHPVENGGLGIIGLAPDPDDGRFPKIEITCGDMKDRYRAYQDYEIFGDKGRLWRTGDQATPNLYIQNGHGGSWVAGLDDKWVYRPLPPEGEAVGPWTPVEVDTESVVAGIPGGYKRFYDTIVNGTPHPMCAEKSIQGFEIIMAIYESARLRKKIELPLTQERFPLELMVEDGIA